MTDTFTPPHEQSSKKGVGARRHAGPDGAPQVTPVWVMLDGEDIIINTALGRAKARNLASDSRVAVSLTDPDDLYAAIVVRGSSPASRPRGRRRH